MIRTRDLLVRKAKQGDLTGQHKAAAPVSSNEFDHLSQPGSTPNFYPSRAAQLSNIASALTRGAP